MKRPLKGGRYQRDADTGKLTKIKAEPKAAAVQPDKPATTASKAGKGKSE